MHTNTSPPILTIITPHYNMPQGLPRLFDNVLAQSLKSLEVLVVDDGSHLSCREVVEAYQNKGLAVRLIEHGVNRGPKQARITGLEGAYGRIGMFIDADDFLWGTEALEYHVRLFLREDADMVSFSVMEHKPESNSEKFYRMHAPFAPSLDGHSAFAAYAQTGRVRALWGKLYDKGLWRKCLDLAKAVTVYRPSEDDFLSTIFFAHCRKYRGSNLIGYGYALTPMDIRIKRSALRILTRYRIIHLLLPRLLERGIPSNHILNCEIMQADLLERNAVLLYKSMHDEEKQFSMDIYKELMHNVDLQEFILAINYTITRKNRPKYDLKTTERTPILHDLLNILKHSTHV